MSTNENKYVATLVRGEFYGLPKQSFRPGERHVVSEEIMFHLQEHAVYIRSIHDAMRGEVYGEEVEMFTFTPFTGPEPAGYRFPTPEELAVADAAKAAKAQIDDAPARPRTRPRAA